MRRLIVAADSSLMLEAISIGLRRSGEFKVLGHVDPRSPSWPLIVDAAPDVVLVDDLDRSEPVLEFIRRVRVECPQAAVIVLAVTMDAGWLDAVFDAGASSVISKATHLTALATLVRETVNGHMVHHYQRSETAGGHLRDSATGEDSSLTARELEILRLVAAGATNGEIARSLWVTEQTVKFHLSNVYRKLDVVNRTEASHYAHVNGLVGGPSRLAVT